jgi:hypothetical protein
MNILHTTDGGDNWYIQTSGSSLFIKLNDICFLNSSYGWAAGEPLLSTNDGGDTWNFHSIECYPPNNKYKELNGHPASHYLEKAKILFEEMDLQWDLETYRNFVVPYKK